KLSVARQDETWPSSEPLYQSAGDVGDDVCVHPRASRHRVHLTLEVFALELGRSLHREVLLRCHARQRLSGHILILSPQDSMLETCNAELFWLLERRWPPSRP